MSTDTDSSTSSALVSTQQRSALRKLLAKSLATCRLVDLQAYLQKGGLPSAVIYYSRATDRWYPDQADHVGADQVRGGTILCPFCRDNLQAHVLALLQAGADIDGGDQTFTPLSAAANSGSTQMIQLLLERGAQVDYDSGNGTALVTACGDGQLAAVELLLAAGADIHCLLPRSAGAYP